MEEKKENEFLEFMKKSKYSITIIIIFILFAFGERIISNSFSIDTEHYIYNVIKGTTVNWDWWMSLSRWGLVLINKIYQIGEFPIYASNYLTIITMVAYSILFNYLFYKNLNDKYKSVFLKYQFIFPMIFLTNPIFAEQYNFIHQNFGVALGILIIPVALLFIEKAMNTDRILDKIIYYIIAVFISVIAFAIYQSIILLYIVTVVSCYFLRVIKDSNNNWSYLLKHIFLFAASAVIYIIVSKTLVEQSAYLQMAWLKESAFICLKNILYCVKETIKCTSIFFNFGYVLSIILSLALCIYLILKKKLKIGIIISIIALLMAPFYIMIITGVDQLKRTQFNYSYVIGFILMITVVLLANKKDIKLKIVKYIVLALALIITYIQAYTSASLFYTSDIVYENDKSMASKLAYEIKDKEWYNPTKEYTLIFVGQYKCQSKNIYTRGEIIGSSFFDFDYENIWGVNERANVFLGILGYEFIIPTIEQFEKAKEYLIEHQIEKWPNKESIVLINDNEIIVKLSDEIKETNV